MLTWVIKSRVCVSYETPNQTKPPTTTQNQPKPPKTSQNHPKLPTTIQNHPQPNGLKLLYQG